MRTTIFVLTIFIVRTSPISQALANAEPISAPTPEQLAAAKETYAKCGFSYMRVADPTNTRTVHCFRAKNNENDAALKELTNRVNFSL